MKKGFFILSAFLLTALMTLPALADRKGHGAGYGHFNPDRDDSQQKSRQNNSGDRDRDRDRERHGERGHDKGRDHGRDHNYRKPGHHPHGYRNQPHGRHYEKPHMRKGHAYHYDGHWNSYDAWEGYRKLHPERFHSGGYYRESGHLFFRFCDPVDSACFFFSIGR